MYSFSLDRKERFATKYFVFLYSYFFVPLAPLVPVVKGYATPSHIYDVICDVKNVFLLSMYYTMFCEDSFTDKSNKCNNYSGQMSALLFGPTL